MDEEISAYSVYKNLKRPKVQNLKKKVNISMKNKQNVGNKKQIAGKKSNIYTENNKTSLNPMMTTKKSKINKQTGGNIAQQLQLKKKSLQSVVNGGIKKKITKNSLPPSSTTTTTTKSSKKSMQNGTTLSNQDNLKNGPSNKKRKKTIKKEAAATVANAAAAVPKKTINLDEYQQHKIEMSEENSSLSSSSLTLSSHSNPMDMESSPHLIAESSKPPKNDSIIDGIQMFKWLIYPIEIDNFFQKFWEKAPVVVERENLTYFSKLISFEVINKMLLNNHLEFTKNIDITSYKNGIRETLNPEGRAMPNSVWEKYDDGCSIRLLNPQTFIPAIYTLNATLQEYFHCMVGANVYLTPPNSQGFAPHYDDIEAFVLQIEGKKRWRLYNPRNKNEELPRVSSMNFQQTDIGEPILEKLLEPGDIMYFPRGTIHQAYTEPGYHSLHITLSVYQRQSYADLFEKLLPIMLQQTINQDVDFRRGLPLNIWNNFGIVHSDIQSKERTQIFKKCRDLLSRVIANLPIDDAVDQLAKKYQHEALPPDITATERCRTVFACRNVLNHETGFRYTDYELNLNTKIRLLRANILRLIQEDNNPPRIYFYIDNSKEYQEYDLNFLEIEPDDALAVEILIKSYPDYVYVKDIPLEDDEKKILVIQALWERGLLMTNVPI